VAARKVAFRAQARGGVYGTCRWKAPRAFRAGAALTGGSRRGSWLAGTDSGMPGKGTGSDRGCLQVSLPGPHGAEDAPASSSSGHRVALRGGEADGSWRHSVNCVSTQGREGRQRLIDVAVDGRVLETRAKARAEGRGRLQRSEGRKPQAWEWGVPAGTRDNKSVAEISERHPLASEQRHLGAGGSARVAGCGDPSP